MFKNNKNLVIIALIAIVNALGYGIIIPILYSYSRRFGLSDFQNGLLFAIFSLCQFLSTPFIGRMSDKYGRRPLLLISLVGTAISFLMMAFAPSAIFLFIARALDGLTAGNIPVATAVISDTTPPQDRAKGFGIIGAAFGFGFVFGPAISALTVGWNPSLPFVIAASVTIIAIILTWIMLPETNAHIGEVSHAKLFDFKKLILSIFDENVGKTLIISFLYSLALSLFIYAFQPFAVKILHLTPVGISSIFTAFGIVGFVVQAFIIPRTIKRFAEKKLLTVSLSLTVITFASFFFARNLGLFLFVTVFQAFANSYVNPLIQALLSKEVDSKSQGSILGLQSSYLAIGMIVGPILGGILATISIPLPFLAASLMSVMCVFLSLQILRKSHVVHEF